MKKLIISTLVFGFLFAFNTAQAQQYQGQPAPVYQNAAYQPQQPYYPQQQAVYTPPQGQQPQPGQAAPQPGTYPAPPAGYYYNAPAPMMVTIHTGTPIELETMYPLNGKNLSQGQTVDLRVKYDVMVNGMKVVSAGAPARAIVSSAQKNKMFGKAGEIQLMPQYVQSIDGQFLPVTGMPSNFEGKNRKALAWGGIAAGAVTGGIGFLALPFIKGKAVEVPAGTTLTCSVLGERTLPVYPAYRQ